MPRHVHPAGWAAIAVVAVPLGLYTMFLGLGMTALFQKQ